MCMSYWLLVFIIVAGGLFGFKVIYILCAAWVLPRTQGALYVSTSRVRISSILNAVSMTSDQLLIDLGCGDGRVLRAAKKRYGVKTLGYELNPLAYIKAKLLCKNIDIRRKDFFNQNLSNADIIFFYLFPDVMKRLSSKLRSELKPGTTIISCNFCLPGYSPTHILRPKGSLYHDPIYIYSI